MTAPLTSTQQLLEIMARLRNKENGCPWDVEQNFSSIAPHTLEEAYEVVDAIDNKDMDGLREELGDLLLQVVFHAQMAKEEKLFDFEQVAAGICEKLIRRHPHVFGDADIKTSEAQTASWEVIKAEERSKKGKTAEPKSVLDGIPGAFPALMRAVKLQKRAAKVGFDWPSTAPIFEKLHEELNELHEAIASPTSKDHIAEELGDLLFVCTNLARHLKIDPEEALRATNRKFERRFKYVEQKLGDKLEQSSLAEMDALWDEAKKKERVA